ncbi:MAG: hypothetical protein HY231_23840 [Acidobacteria bacterium]|nr:hypothetical protein [Acidobacteriota bacterium]
MPLIACPDCNQRISTVAVNCPACGRPNLPPQSYESESSGILSLLQILIIVAGVIIAVLFKANGIGALGYGLIVLGLLLVIFRVAK